MKRMSRGLTLIETLIVVVIVGILLLVLLQLFTVSHRAYVVTTTKPWVQSNAASAVNAIAREVRRAAICAEGGSCIQDSAFGAAEPDALTLYSSENGDPITFAVQNGQLVRIDSTGTQPMGDGDAELTLRYCRALDAAYHIPVPVEQQGWENEVSGEGLKQIIAVEITLQLRRGDLVDSFQTVVRPRTSPKKVSPTS